MNACLHYHRPVLTIQLSPNCSLTPRGSGAVLRAASARCRSRSPERWRCSGLWPIFPFAGLEMLVLGWALHAQSAAPTYSQTIIVTEERVAVETRDGTTA